MSFHRFMKRRRLLELMTDHNPTTDYKSLLRKYMREVISDDSVVGFRCAWGWEGGLDESDKAALKEIADELRAELGYADDDPWVSPPSNWKS